MSDNHSRIVLVEDNPADVFFLRRALDTYGDQYRAEVLEDGERALDFVRENCTHAGERAPCVLVLDLHLPKYDGAQVLRAIRQEPKLDNLRVVAITGFASPQEETTIKSLGVRLYRQKPADLEGYRRLAEEIIAICKEHALKAAV